MAGEPAEDGERGLDPLTAHPIQRPDEHDLEAAEPSVGERLAEHLAVPRAAVARGFESLVDQPAEPVPAPQGDEPAESSLAVGRRGVQHDARPRLAPGY